MPTIGNAPSGEDTASDGTEKIPVSGSKYMLVSTIAEYIRTLTQTLTNKTLTAPTIADFTNAAHDHGDADDGGAVVSASTTVAGVAELATDAEALTGTSSTVVITPANIAAIFATVPDGTMYNGKLSVTVVSSDLVVALVTASGGTPSATDPVWVKINGSVRKAVAATSCTLADATNWFGSGGATLAALEIDYFAYAVWDSNSSVVAITRGCTTAPVPSGNPFDGSVTMILTVFFQARKKVVIDNLIQQSCGDCDCAGNTVARVALVSSVKTPAVVIDGLHINLLS